MAGRAGPAGGRDAQRVDEATGVTERAAFRELDGTPILTVTHVPAQDPATSGVVVCSSVYAEFLGGYRRDVLLARALAANGVAVARLHYRGTGNSGGAPAEFGFDDLCDDVVAAAGWLRDDAGVADVAFVGTRFGALPAAAAASRLGGRLVLWDPVVAADRYFREAFRARLMREMKSANGATPGRSTEDFVAELLRVGSVEAVGYTIHRRFYETARGRTLTGLLPAAPDPVLLVQLGKSSTLRAELAGVVETWRLAGADVEVDTIAEDPAWWFVGEDWQAEENRAATASLVARSSAWLARPAPTEVRP